MGRPSDSTSCITPTVPIKALKLQYGSGTGPKPQSQSRVKSNLTPLQTPGLVFLLLPHLGWSSTASIPVGVVQKQQLWGQTFSILAMVLWVVGTREEAWEVLCREWLNRELGPRGLGRWEPVPQEAAQSAPSQWETLPGTGLGHRWLACSSINYFINHHWHSTYDLFKTSLFYSFQPLNSSTTNFSLALVLSVTETFNVSYSFSIVAKLEGRLGSLERRFLSVGESCGGSGRRRCHR